MSEIKLRTTPNAAAVLAEFERNLEAGHPWLPGADFKRNPSLGEAVRTFLAEWADKNTPAETCTCEHKDGGYFEDHTPGNGCERTGCGCRFWIEEN